MSFTSNRWFRAERHRSEIDQLFDLYWGVKERRITTLTLKIMGVNLIAVVTLIFGVVYLSQYHTMLVEAKLEHFETEIMIVTAAMADGALEVVKDENDVPQRDSQLSVTDVARISGSLGATLGKRILVFNKEGEMVVDSKQYIREHSIKPIFKVVKEPSSRLDSIELLKDMAVWIVSFFPKHNTLPVFHGIESKNASDYYDASDALKKNLSMSAWRSSDDEKYLVLTAAMPILDHSRIRGVVMMVNDDNNIYEAIGDAWFDIVKIFFVTLVVTILLSIYLSGVIAGPLRKLAIAAENVRKGKMKYTEIPDMGDRNDEIGELSLVLRDMTHALWERMDTIEAFAADVSHEIKNPLTSLKSAVETAMVVKNKKDLNRLLEVIKEDIERLDRLITDISHASRLDAELSRELFIKVDLKKLLHNLIDAYKAPLDRKESAVISSDEAEVDGVRITLSVPERTNVYVYGSEMRLIQVFQNIVTNALTFSPKGAVVRILVTLNDKRVTIAIEDEGPGIPDKQFKNVFERFYSERPNHEKYGQHSGLGLSICKQIITAHNGVIFAENRRDMDGNISGARFVVILNSTYT
ncbi:MAG: sensor N-terminal transmembrane domain-containing protein [Alphaproteobacteria bacterium]|nr:sensor N-terminal transmembrane domain-containing protein [Alphaproteobacteria bacterium]